MTSWSRTHKTIIDQRGESLPPAWLPREVVPCTAPPQRGRIFRTEGTRQAARAVRSAVDRAQRMVAVTSFLLADKDVEGALLRAAKRGVRVYVLLATEARLEREARADSEFEREVLEDHKRMLEALAGWCLIRSSKDFHAKAVLVDPLEGGPAFLLTANLTERALDRNEEIVVELTQQQARALFEHLRWAIWEAADHELLEPGRLAAASEPLGLVAKPETASGVVATMNEAGSLRAAALEVVRAATSELVVASFGWDADHEVVQAILERARQGIKVTALVRIRPAITATHIALASAGVTVVGFKWLHAKAICADGAMGLVMSANLQKVGLDDGFELGVRLGGDDARDLARTLDGWIAAAPYELRVAPTLGEVRGEAQVWVDKQLVPYAVVPRVPVEADPITAASADVLDAAPKAAKWKYGLPQPAHELDVSYTVQAPRLAPKSKEVESKSKGKANGSSPKVFREPSGRVVVAVRDADEITGAQEMAKAAKAVAIVVRELP